MNGINANNTFMSVTEALLRPAVIATNDKTLPGPPYGQQQQCLKQDQQYPWSQLNLVTLTMNIENDFLFKCDIS